MSHQQNPQSWAFRFGCAFTKMLPKGSSSTPPELTALLVDFETNLANRVHHLMPTAAEKTLQFSWMIRAMEQLCAIHTDVEKLSTALALPIYSWKDKWIQKYFDDTLKLLDVLNSFIAQIQMLEQSHLYLVCAVQHLSKGTPEGSCKARSSLHQWMELISLKDPSVAQRCSVLDGIVETPDLRKRADKEKVLTRALYGFKVVAFFVSCVFTAVFCGAAERLAKDVKVPSLYLWAGAFVDLQTAVSAEVGNVRSSGKAIVAKEVKAIAEGVEKVYPVLGCCEGVGLANDLGRSAEEFSRGLESLSKEVDGFFKMVLARRNSLMGRLSRVELDQARNDKDKEE